MLISVDNCLDFLNLDSKYRDRVELLTSWVQARAESIIRRKLDKADYTWQLDGQGSHSVQLPVIPVNSVTGVYLDSDRVFETAEETSDYYLDSDTGIISFYNKILFGFKTIKVVANAGYDEETFPADLKLAFYEAIQWNLSRVQDRMFGVSTQSTPDGVSLAYEMVLPMGVQRVFESYRDMVY